MCKSGKPHVISIYFIKTLHFRRIVRTLIRKHCHYNLRAPQTSGFVYNGMYRLIKVVRGHNNHPFRTGSFPSLAWLSQLLSLPISYRRLRTDGHQVPVASVTILQGVPQIPELSNSLSKGSTMTCSTMMANEASPVFSFQAYPNKMCPQSIALASLSLSPGKFLARGKRIGSLLRER